MQTVTSKNINNLLQTDTKLEILGKIIFTIFLIFISITYFTSSSPWTFLDYANLLIHEGGHAVFIFAGKFIEILGGSLTQILVPILFIIYFVFKKNWYSAAFCVYWLGVNFINVGRYIVDAKPMALPLISDNLIHDWNYLMSHLNLLDRAEGLGNLVINFGKIIIIGGFVGMIGNIVLKFKN